MQLQRYGITDIAAITDKVCAEWQNPIPQHRLAGAAGCSTDWERAEAVFLLNKLYLSVATGTRIVRLKFCEGIFDGLLTLTGLWRFG